MKALGAAPPCGQATIGTDELITMIGDAAELLRASLDKIICGEMQRVATSLEITSGGQVIRLDVAVSTRAAP